MHKTPAELLEMDDDGSWLVTLIAAHNDANTEGKGVPLT